MADEEIQEVPEYATLVDRTGGPGEFWFAGRPWTFTRAKPTRTVPLYVAMWLMADHRNRVWTLEGQFTHRFAVKDGPESLLTELGEDAFDTSPITIDAQRAEGWNTETADRPDATRTIAIRRQPGDYTNQAGAAQPTFAGKER